jgi:membrane glycosyltransferase
MRTRAHDDIASVAAAAVADVIITRVMTIGNQIVVAVVVAVVVATVVADPTIIFITSLYNFFQLLHRCRFGQKRIGPTLQTARLVGAGVIGR